MTIPRLLLLALLTLLAPLASAAVSSTTNQVSYTGTGSNATFAIPFYYFQNSDIVATENNSGTITTLALTTDYTLVNNGIPGGTLTLVAGNLASGVVLTIQRDPVLTQTTYFSAQGPLPPAAIGNALDLLCMQIQAARQTSSRALQLPLGDTGTVILPSAQLRANSLLGFDSSGNAISVANNASGTSVTATGSTTARLLANRFADVVNVFDYGAVGNGTTDDTAAIQAAMNAVTTSAGGLLIFPHTAAGYLISSALTIPAGANQFQLIGYGKPIITQATSNTPIFLFQEEGPAGWAISGFQFYWSTNQTSADPNSIGIAFNSSTHTSVGFFDFLISDCDFVNGWRGISQYPGSGSLPVWGCTIQRVTASQRMTGAIIAIGSLSGSDGSPRIRIEQVYVRRDVCTEASIQVSVGVQLDMQDVEFNGDGPYDNCVLITTVSKIRIQNIRWEGTQQTSNNSALCTISGSEADATISSAEVSSHVVSGSNDAVFYAVNNAAVRLVDTSIGGNLLAPVSYTGSGALFLCTTSGTAAFRIGGLCKLQSIVQYYDGGAYPEVTFDDQSSYNFYTNALAANTSAAQMLAQGATSNSWIVQKKGRIIGISAWIKNLLTAGTITIQMYKNGSPLNSGTNLTYTSADVANAKQVTCYPYSIAQGIGVNPGDQLQIYISSTSGQLPTPVDVIASIMVGNALDY